MSINIPDIISRVIGIEIRKKYSCNTTSVMCIKGLWICHVITAFSNIDDGDDTRRGSSFMYMKESWLWM